MDPNWHRGGHGKDYEWKGRLGHSVMELGVNASAFHLLKTALFAALRMSSKLGVASTRRHVFVYIKSTGEPLVNIEYAGEEKALTIGVRSSMKSKWGKLPVDIEANEFGVVLFYVSGSSISAQGMAELILKRVAR